MNFDVEWGLLNFGETLAAAAFSTRAAGFRCDGSFAAFAHTGPSPAYTFRNLIRRGCAAWGQDFPLLWLQ
jgi:hypothetical protein